jgi:MFS family permease
MRRAVDGWSDETLGKAYDHRVVVRLAGYVRPYKARTAVAIIGTVLAAQLAQWFSRRLAYFGLALGSIAACAYLFWSPIWLPHFFESPLEYGSHFLITVGVVGGLTASFYGWLPLYLPELFPTRVRATGQGFAFNMGRVLAAGGTLLSGQLLNAFGEDYAAMCRVISLVYVFGLVVIWFCPETKGKPLPE